MEHYVTLFDSAFLPQGLALQASLERHGRPYTLWILCVDADAFRVLTRLDLPHVRLLSLDQLETDELRRVKPTRTRGEYCWTLTPFAPRFVFEADSTVRRVTYLDADLWFRGSPLPIFREFEASGKSVLITDHEYAPEFDQSATSGKYCVQFMTFVQEKSERVRQHWEAQCLEWCYARFEANKFGDQKYLDEWPQRFPDDVYVLQNGRLLLAPWNAVRGVAGCTVLYHFQGLRLNADRVRFSPDYHLPAAVIRELYEPYVDELRTAVRTLESVGWSLRDQIGGSGTAQRFMLVLKELKRTCEKIVTRQQARIRRAA